MERKTRSVNAVFLFAAWWFGQESGEQVDAQEPKFRTMLGKAKRLKAEGFELGLVQRTVLTMRAQGVEVTSPYAIKWQSPIRGKTWYEYSSPVQPPVWDKLLTGLYTEGAIPLRVS